MESHAQGRREQTWWRKRCLKTMAMAYARGGAGGGWPEDGWDGGQWPWSPVTAAVPSSSSLCRGAHLWFSSFFPFLYSSLSGSWCGCWDEEDDQPAMALAVLVRSWWRMAAVLPLFKKKAPPCLFFSFIYVAVGLTWDPFWRPPLTETKKTVIVACSTWNPVWRFPLTKMKYEVPSGDLLNIEIRDLFWRSPLTNNL